MIRVASLPAKMFQEFAEVEHPTLPYFNSSGFNCNLFKEAIIIASPDLFNSLVNMPKTEKKLRNIEQSIIKYSIRSSTRPTPYGMFAGVALGEFADKSKLVFDEKEYIRDIQVDVEWLYCLIHILERDINILNSLQVRFNPLCYSFGSRIVNPSYTNHGENVFQISNVNKDMRYTKLISLIEELARKLVPYSELKQVIQEKYPDVSKKKIDTTLMMLLENEYLYTNLRIPPYHNNTLEYLYNIIKRIPAAEKYTLVIKELIRLFNEYKMEESKVEILEQIYALMESLVCKKNYIAVNKGLKMNENNLSGAVKKQVEKFVNTLSLIPVAVGESTHLGAFKRAFIEAFGYGVEVNLKDIINVNGFNGLQYVGVSEYNVSAREKEIKNIIDQKIQTAVKLGKESISLAKEDFSNISQNENDNCHAISFDINFYVSQKFTDNGHETCNLTVAPNGGAIQAGAMFQRFSSVLDEQLMNNYNTLYKEEIDLTSNYYELVEIRESFSAGRLGNLVNTNKNYNYCVVLDGCSEEKEGILSAYDLSIGLSFHGELYIYSSKLKKHIKIVTDNMVNPELNSPLFRLLKDISDEYEDKPLSRIFNLTKNEYIYTPRILLEGVVISPKTWKFSFHNDKLDCLEEFQEAFTQLANQYEMDDYILVYQKDNRLLLNRKKKWGVKLIYAIARKDSFVKISEVPEGMLNSQVVSDGRDNKYMSEITFSFLCKEGRYINEKELNTKVGIERSLQADNKKFYLGENGWMYLKLYGARNRQNMILIKCLKELLDDIECERYFFLRYADDAPHLRLRIKFDSENKMYKYMPRVLTWIRFLQKEELIYRVTFDTYDRELNRYGGTSVITAVEDVFFGDSQYVVSLLRMFKLERENEEQILYIFGILSILLELTDSRNELYEVLQLPEEDKSYNVEFRKKQDFIMQIVENTLKGAIENIDERLKESLSIYLKRKEKLQFLKKALYFAPTLTETKQHILLSICHMFCNRLTGKRNLEAKYLQLIRIAIRTLKKREEFFNKL